MSPPSTSLSNLPSFRQRVRWIQRFRRLLVDRAPTLSAMLVEELDKTPLETLTADLMPLLASCRWHERHARRALAPRRIRHGAWWQLGQRHWLYRLPRGRVAIIATWNYPIQLLGIQIVQAIVAGNRVTVKPSEHAPRTQATLLDLFWEAGVPRWALETRPATRQAGPDLLNEEAFDHIVLTGSTQVGRAVAATAASDLITSTLELTGRDSAFVLEDADPRHAAQAIWEAVELNGGQTCIAPRRALVLEPVYSALIRQLSSLAAAAQPRRLIEPGQAEHVHHLVREAIAAGGVSLSGTLEPPDEGWIRPIAVGNCPVNTDLVAGNHFGPALAVIPVKSIDEALRIHLSCDQHLATSVFTKNPRRVRGLVGSLGAGTVTFNDVVRPSAHPATSMLGRGASGWGASQGMLGLLEMTRPVQIATTVPRLRPTLPAMTNAAFQRLNRVVSWSYRGKKNTRSPLDRSTVAPTTTQRSAPKSASHNGTTLQEPASQRREHA